MMKRYAPSPRWGCGTWPPITSTPPSPTGAGEDAPDRHCHRRAGRFDAGGRQGGGGVHLPGGPDGPRRRHAPDHRHPAALRRRDHRPDEGQHPLPHRLRRGLLPGVPDHPGHHRRGEAGGPGRHALLPLGSGKPQRVQGCLISDEEVAAVVGFIKEHSGTAEYSEEIIHEIEQHAAEKEKQGKGVGGSAPEEVGEEFDELLPAAIEVVVETGMASVSMLQRRLKLGYSGPPGWWTRWRRRAWWAPSRAPSPGRCSSPRSSGRRCSSSRHGGRRPGGAGARRASLRGGRHHSEIARTPPFDL